MTDDELRRLANVMMYEGYLLYPYRPSVKNVRRWTFGSLYPRAHAERRGERSHLRTEVLVEGGADTSVCMSLRFLQVQERLIRRFDASGEENAAREECFTPVASLDVAGETFLTWQEGVEHELALGSAGLEFLAERSVFAAVRRSGQRSRELLRDLDGTVVGDVVRERREILGGVDVSAQAINEHLRRLLITVRNQTVMTDPEDALDAERRGLMGTHLILRAERGRFLSLTDPPADRAAVAATCANEGCWPVLVGDRETSDALLVSPIILPDFPELAPESPGDLFDGTEIDEILSLRIRTLTDSEKKLVDSVDPRARALLARTERLTRGELVALHGTWRPARKEVL
jgi:hydrogenase maturation protease